MTIPCGEIHHGNKQLIHDCQRKEKIPEPLDDYQLQIKANQTIILPYKRKRNSKNNHFCWTTLGSLHANKSISATMKFINGPRNAS